MVKLLRCAALFALVFVFTEQASGAQPSRHCLYVLDQLRHLSPAETPPALMAVGDSLYNGVTSLTIDQLRAAHGAAALIAKALPKSVIPKFVLPAYPTEEPVLFNAESALQAPLWDLALTFGNSVQKNIAYWRSQYPATYAPTMPNYFDDVAVAQANSVQLMCDSGNEADLWLRTANPQQADGFRIPNQIAEWYYMINARFILNPRLKPSPITGLPQSINRGSLSQLGQVMVRQPERLLIWIGNNDGVWLMAFRGYSPDTPYNPAALSEETIKFSPASKQTTVRQEMGDLIENMKTIAKSIPERTQHIYMNNLPPPSRTANLVPIIGSGPETPCDNDPTDPSHTALYFQDYVNYLSDEGISLVSGKTACEMDSLVNEANANIKKVMSGILGSRLVVIDINSMLMKIDGKHLGPGHGIRVNFPTPFGPKKSGVR